MTMPMTRLDFVAGYGLAFAGVGLVQAAVVTAVTTGLLRASTLGGVVPLLVAAVMAAVLGTSLGLLVSAFATTEFQAVELVMPIMMPQMLLCGLFAPRDTMARLLRYLSDILPLTYSVEAMKQAAFHSAWSGRYLADVAVVLGCSLLALGLAAVSIKRRG